MNESERRSEIWVKFRKGLDFNEIMSEYDIDKNQLVQIIRRKIRGKYDWDRILTSHLSQQQFILHLNSRWVKEEESGLLAYENENSAPAYLPKNGAQELIYPRDYESVSEQSDEEENFEEKKKV